MVVWALRRRRRKSSWAFGITALTKPFWRWTSTKRKIKRDIGYESDAGVKRAAAAGRMPDGDFRPHARDRSRAGLLVVPSPNPPGS